jgi:hypothetical protein
MVSFFNKFMQCQTVRIGVHSIIIYRTHKHRDQMLRLKITLVCFGCTARTNEVMAAPVCLNLALHLAPHLAPHLATHLCGSGTMERLPGEAHHEYNDVSAKKIMKSGRYYL